MTCPYTSQQNGRAERVLRTLNDGVRALLFQASVPSSFWPDALATSTYLLNRRPCRARGNATPFALLFGAPPDYSHLRIFGCLCYPNTAATAPHKLAPRSARCVFLGYPMDQHGYKCYNPETRRVIISRHVFFDESCFPFAQIPVPDPATAHRCMPCAPDILPLSVPRRSQAPQPRSTRVQHVSTSPTAPQPDPQSAEGPSASASPSPEAPMEPLASPATTSASPASAQPPVAPPRHHMVTRGRDRIRVPNPRYANVATTSTTPSPPTSTPSSVCAALRDPEWRAAMQEEFNALQGNGIWTLVPRPPNANIITEKWIFKNKLNPDGTLERRKARWVVRGFSQRPRIDFHQTFSPVVKPSTIRTVLHLAATLRWPMHQLDIKNAFLHGDLAERVYYHQPAGFVDEMHPDHVCLLVKSLYGLKQAPRAWFQRLGNYLRAIGFTSIGSDTSLFVYKKGDAIAYLLVYVDDIILTASTTSLLQHVVQALCREFAIKDLRVLRFFLDVQCIVMTMDSSSPRPSTLKTSSSVLAWQIASLQAHRSTSNRSCQPLTVNWPRTARSIGASRAQCSISLLHARILHMQSTRRAYICTRHVLLIGTLSSGSFVIFAAPSTTVLPSQHRHRLSSGRSSMPIGQDARTLGDRRRAIVFSWAIHWSPSPQRDNQPSRDRALKRSIGLWPMLLQNAAGCAIFSRSFMSTSTRPLSSTAITSPRFISLTILSIIDR